MGTREFGKRVPVRELRDQPGRPTPAASAPPVSPKASGIDPVQMKKSLFAIALTFAVVGGMFLLPAMGQCDGHRGALGVDWCQSMKAGLEGAVRGVAVGAGASRGTPFLGR